MSDQDFRPADTDPAKQHFAHAALEEFARMGGKDDEVFLAKIGGELDEIDCETDVKEMKNAAMPRPGRAKMLWISGAAAAVVVFVVIPVLHRVTDETPIANAQQTYVASVPPGAEQDLTEAQTGLGTGSLPSNQSSEAAIINWQNFSVNAGNTTQFNQIPGELPLSKVTGGGVSAIYGILSPPGSVLGVNPNEVFVGAGEVIDVGGMLTLSTLDIDNEDFLNGGSNRFYGNSNNGIINYGSIRSGGDAMFLGGFSHNLSSIESTAGTVAMASGGDIVVGQSGNSIISIRGSSSYGGIGVNGFGTITGGAADLQSHGGVYAQAINNGGITRATGGSPKNGRSRLFASGTHRGTKSVASNTLSAAVSNPEPGHSASRPNEPSDRQLILNEFKVMGGRIEEKVVDQVIDRMIISEFGGDRTKFESKLLKDGITINEFRSNQKDEISIRAMVAKHTETNPRVEQLSSLEERIKIHHEIVGEFTTAQDKPGQEDLEKEISKRLRQKRMDDLVTKLRKKAVLEAEQSIQVMTQNEKYGQLIDNPFTSPLKDPLSTFSVDVDTASYSNIRRMITAGQMIPSDAMRIEEMINYFSYDYPQPEGEHPFSFAAETAKCPWNPDHQLLRVAIQGKDLQRDARQPANLVFLLDVSGSMNDPNKLPLVKQSMELLIEELTGRDTISIVVYADSEGLCLPATSGSEKQKILDSLNRLQAGGSTNGGAGIELAYKMAKENYKADGINRVVLCTDGDFNMGRVDNGSLVELVEKNAKDGTFLSVLGFGSGNINDSMLEEITNKGNGNYFYIDSIKEGRKVLLEEMMSTLVTIAKDVKIQVEFNPKQVQDYRLIGYANRMLKAEDFENDKVDAGEVGAGHSVTALYEIVPVGAPPIQKHSPNLKYQAPLEPGQPKMKLVESHELCTLKLRYKLPKSEVSIPMELAITAQQREWKEAGDDYQFAAAVGLWGMLLREAEHCGKASSNLILEMAEQGRGADPFGRRAEFITLVKEWARLKEMGGVSQKEGLKQNDVFHGGVRLNVGF